MRPRPCRQFTVAGLITETTASALSQTSAVAGSDTRASATCFDYLRDLIGALCAVVQHGTKRLFHALPRLVTLLVEYGDDILRLEEAGGGKAKPAEEAGAMLERLLRVRKERHDAVRSRNLRDA